MTAAPDPVSLPRFAPLGDMALYFDGRLDTATAVLPADTFPSDASDLAFAFTFWMSPGPAGWDTVVNRTEAEAEAEQTVLDVGSGPDDPLGLITLKYGPGHRFGVVFPRSMPDEIPVDLPETSGKWLYVMFAYSPFRGRGNPAAVTMAFSDGGPGYLPKPTPLKGSVQLKAESRTLTLAQPVDDTKAVPYQGMLTRLRLWGHDLTPDTAFQTMWAEPIGPKAYEIGSLRADWRMNEGYGTTAFDYANPGDGLLPIRYRPPTGSHLHLGGSGTPATEPTWAVGELTTLVRAATAQPTAQLLREGNPTR
jgi:hypothetical protein